MGSYTARELARDTGFDRRTIAYYVQEGLLPRVGRRGPRTRYPELVRDRLLFIGRVREAEAEGEITPVTLSDLRTLFRHAAPGLIAGVAAGEVPVTPDIVSPVVAERRAMADREMLLRERLSARDVIAARAPPLIKRAVRSTRLFRSPRRDDSMDDPEAGSLGDVAGTRESAAGPEERHVAHERPYPAAASPYGDLEGQYLDLEDAHPDLEDAHAALEPAHFGLAPVREAPETRVSPLSRVLRMLQAQARSQRRRAPEAVDIWSQVDVTPDIRLSVRGMAGENAILLRWAGRLLRRVLEGEPPPAEEDSRERGE